MQAQSYYQKKDLTKGPAAKKMFEAYTHNSNKQNNENLLGNTACWRPDLLNKDSPLESWSYVQV